MIDYTILGLTLALLIGGVVYACLCSNVGGTEADLDTKQRPDRTAPVLGNARRPDARGRVVALGPARCRRVGMRR